jgi:hypothetical protein
MTALSRNGWAEICHPTFMKYYRCLYIFIFALSVKAYAYAYQPKIEIVEQFDNLKMIAFINKEDVDNNPSWIPGSNKLPLTVAEAVHAVNVLSKKLNTIVEIEIRAYALTDKAKIKIYKQR